MPSSHAFAWILYLVSVTYSYMCYISIQILSVCIYFLYYLPNILCLIPKYTLYHWRTTYWKNPLYWIVYWSYLLSFHVYKIPKLSQSFMYANLLFACVPDPTIPLWVCSCVRILQYLYGSLYSEQIKRQTYVICTSSARECKCILCLMLILLATIIVK